MACSPVPKVGGAAAPSAPPVPTPMINRQFLRVLMNVYCCRIFVVDGSKTAMYMYLSVDNLATVTGKRRASQYVRSFCILSLAKW